MELIDYFLFAFPVNILELAAAVAGTLYLRRVSATSIPIRLFVAFLWFSFVLDSLGGFYPLAHFSKYDIFSFVEGTIFERNNWLYNLYSLVAYSFYPLFFSYFIQKEGWKIFLRMLSLVFVTASIVNLLLTDVFFVGESKFINLFGTLVLFISIVLFFFELLRSNLILNLKRFLPIYLTTGILVFNLCMTPLTIFSEYFNSENALFMDLQVHLILYSNIFMYSIFILGFYICSRKKKSS